MSRFVAQRSRGLAFCGLFLAVLANLGLTVHAGHHSLVAPHSSTSTRVFAGHSEPDPTLHLERVTDVRTLTCPGCVLQHQIGGSHLPAARSLAQPAIKAGRIIPVAAEGVDRHITHSAPRGPPSC